MTAVYDTDDVRLIAFYLPQFHPIPENDRWWGKGFTEWTNVTRARPMFEGHYQPHLPSELGFYDLRVPEVREEQARLAREYGIRGFCYYYYWFGGKRLLERPFEEVLASGQPDFPFCLCWANETWTRRWDGANRDVLMAQVHSEEDDARFVQALFPAFRDRRYIRVQGRPLLVVYRASLLKNPARTVATWARECHSAGIPPPFVLAALTFDVQTPKPFGYDGAVEFPPHQARARLLTNRLGLTDPHYKGNVFDYVSAARWFLDRPAPEFPLFPAVMTGWDNTPRRQRHSSVFLGSTPERYGEWLADAVRHTRERHPVGSRLVFINAWNEWAEGAHLEPDQRYGRAYLEATREALTRSTSSGGSPPTLKLVRPALLTAEATALLRLDELFAREESKIRRYASAVAGDGSQAESLLERLTALHTLRADAIRLLGEEVQRAVQEGPADVPHLREIGPLTLEIAVGLSRGLDRIPALKGTLRSLLQRMLRPPKAPA